MPASRARNKVCDRIVRVDGLTLSPSATGSAYVDGNQLPTFAGIVRFIVYRHAAIISGRWRSDPAFAEFRVPHPREPCPIIPFWRPDASWERTTTLHLLKRQLRRSGAPSTDARGLRADDHPLVIAFRKNIHPHVFPRALLLIVDQGFIHNALNHANVA
jgi:hypothetical protein